MAVTEKILTQQDPTPLKQILLYLYSHQTSEEQAAESTVESNHHGFNMVDAPFLSSLAQQVLKGYDLSPKQLLHARLRLPKYHQQLENEEWRMIDLPQLIQAHPFRSMADELISTASHLGTAQRTSAGTLKLEKSPSGIWGLVFYPNVYPSKHITTIGFTHWENGCWHQSAPSVNQTAVADVLRLFGKTVVVDPEVTEMLEVKDDIQLQLQLPLEMPNVADLREYQKDTIKFQILHPHSLIALAPRLGKTVTTIFAAQVAGCRKILVVAPLSLLLDWKRKIKTWSGETAVIVYKKQLLVPARWTITNYDTVRLHPETFSAEGFDAIIVDESLLIKNRKAKRTYKIQELVKSNNPKYLWLLSGAPVSRMYTDLWAQFTTLDPRRFTSFWRFAERYCIVESNQWSNYNLIGDQPDASERIQKDFSDIYFSRSQEDVTDMPPWAIENIPVAMRPYQDKMYAEMEETFLADLGDDGKLMAPNKLAQMVRLVQIASNPVLIGGRDESAKWDATVEMLQYEAWPLIIWTSFIDTAEGLLLRLAMKDMTRAKLTGATPPDAREQIVQDFQNGRLKILIAHPAVGKFGLDLFAAKSVIYLERGYNGDDYYQSLNRVRHIDQKTSPHIVHLLSERAGDSGGNTVDYVIDKVLQGRREKVMKLTSHNIRKMFEEKE